MSDYIDLENLDIDHVLEHSFKNFHVKGFDYICLNRSETDTVKLYFFEDAHVETNEVVNPHWHRYDFWTTALTGGVQNIWYDRGPSGVAGSKCQEYGRFDYRTPLLGGDGFTPNGTQLLHVTKAHTVGPDIGRGTSYFMEWNEIHTINIVKPETCLLLHQFEDKVPEGTPTETFISGADVPDLNDGLYDSMTADEVIAKLKWLNEKVGQV